MYTIKEAIIVEGTYDKIKLSGFLEGIILKTDGFSVFNNKKAQESIKTLAKSTGIVILTDSDSAGLKIRSFLSNLAKDGKVLHAYIPQIEGKEKRKTVASKSGFLGVEGITEEIIISALKNSGAKINGRKIPKKSESPITKTDLFILGLSGGENSMLLRQKLAKELGLPSEISANMLLGVINRLLTLDELTKLVENLKGL